MEKLKLSKLLDNFGDGIHGTPIYDNDGNYFFVNGNNIRNGKVVIDKETPRINDKEYTKIKRNLTSNTILVSINGTLGSIGLYNGEKIALGKSIAFLNLKNDVNKHYIRYILETKEFKKYIELVSHGSMIKNLAPSQIADFLIPKHEKKYQDHIVINLKSIDDKIEINNQINQSIENFIEYIYEYWFVQFDFPNSEGKPYKSSGGKMVWNDEYKSEVPEKWLTSNLYENKLTDIIQPGVVYFNSKNYLATANVVDSNIKDGDWVTFENRESRANMQPVENSVWFAKMKNSIKHITITDADNWILNKYIFSTGFFGLKCTPEALGYMHSIINSNQFEFIKNRLAHGATQEAVNNNDLKSMNIIVPSTDILLKYNRIVLPLIKKMNNNRYENDQLTRLKDFLLPILMNN